MNGYTDDVGGFFCIFDELLHCSVKLVLTCTGVGQIKYTDVRLVGSVKSAEGFRDTYKGEFNSVYFRDLRLHHFFPIFKKTCQKSLLFFHLEKRNIVDRTRKSHIHNMIVSLIENIKAEINQLVEHLIGSVVIGSGGRLVLVVHNGVLVNHRKV